MNDIVLSIMVLGAIAMLGGAWLALKRGDRKRAVLMAILAVVIGANVAILDDGHQHRRLSRALDVLLWDRRQADAAAAFPPALREPLSGAARAGLVLRIDRGQGAPAAPGGVASRAHVTRARLVPVGGEGLTHAARVHALSGIADPESFERSLAGRGLVVTGATRYPDHHAFRHEEIGAAAARAQASPRRWTSDSAPRPTSSSAGT